jgi:uncharacterized protein (TIGR03032 family)
MSETTAAGSEPWLEVTCSRTFPGWLAERRLSLALSTYQAGKLLLIGVGEQGNLSVFERTIERCMGLWAEENSLWLASLYQIWRFVNVLRPGNLHQGYDRLYVPRVGYTTGDLDVHDVALESSGRVVFANTKFSCLATLNETDSFTPLWRPPFLTRLAPEDRCHLNGLALENGSVRYVTAVAACDVADGWRDARRDGGVVIDVMNNRILARGLSMPHSPRVREGRLWLLNSGTGELGWIDDSGAFKSLTFCPGYLRGLAFAGNHAVVGLSGPRGQKTFSGLQLEEELARRGATGRCGLMVIDLNNGDIVHWVRIEGCVQELYDVAVLPGAARPMVLGFKTTEIQQLLSVGE